jgi:hypothetical protein
LLRHDEMVMQRYAENLPRLHELLRHCYVLARLT